MTYRNSALTIATRLQITTAAMAMNAMISAGLLFLSALKNDMHSSVCRIGKV